MMLVFLGAGCGPSRTDAPASPYQAEAFPGMTNDQASKVPNDIPTYPSGFVIAVSGDEKTAHVAQSTPDTGDKVIEWTKAEYKRRGASLKKTSEEGFSTTLLFESATNRYTARIDKPKDGAAFLTISREPNNN